jgi:hypothetical protein
VTKRLRNTVFVIKIDAFFYHSDEHLTCLACGDDDSKGN